MRVLIAGYGYLGAKIAESFVARGFDVTVIRRSAAQKTQGIKFVAADLIVQVPQFRADDFDLAVFCLAPGSRSGDIYEQTYVTAQKNFLAPLRLSRYVYISSTAVYPEISGTYREEMGSPHTDRARILLAAEAVACAEPGAVVLRLAGLYSGERPIYGRKFTEYKEDKLIHFIHRDDAASAVAHSIAKGLSGVYNVHDGKPQWRSTILARLGFSVSPATHPGRIIVHEKLFNTGFRPAYGDYFEGTGYPFGIG